MADYYRDVVRLLKDAGYELKRRGHGDHEIWWDPKTKNHVTVDRKLRSRFTANAILKEADLPKAF
ncbi:MAG TPA: type II toxin-antitoxin system HicA family toxin [Xanthobacteraceae bacterium]|jgi:predicted RNA binding protein YcfA (HicA-like mRNA interferase family)